MPENLEGVEKSKSFSEDEVLRVQDLIRKVREVVEWDLGKMCGSTEEIDMVNKAKGAMKDVEVLFHVPESKSWTAFPGKSMDESIRQAEEYNEASLPGEAITLNSADLETLRASLEAVEEVISW